MSISMTSLLKMSRLNTSRLNMSPVNTSRRFRTGLANIVRATVVAVVVAAVTIAPTGAAHASTPTPGRVPAQEATPHLAVVDQDFFYDGNDDFRIDLQLDGATIALPAATESTLPPTQNLSPIIVIRSYPAVTDPAQIGDIPASAPMGSVSLPLGDVATSRTGGFDIVVTLPNVAADLARSMQPLNLNAPGLYPIEVRVIDVATVATTMTYIDRTPPQIQSEDQLAAGIIAAVGEIGPAPTEEERAAARDDLEQLLSLTDLTDLPLTVLLPPSVIDHILVDDPALQRRVAAALDGQTILGAPSFALEPDAAIGAGITDDLRTAWEAGTAKLQTVLPNATIDATTMLIDAPTSPSGVNLLREIGMKRAIIPNSVYRRADGQIGDYTDPGLLVQLRTDGGDAVPAAVGSPALELLGETGETEAGSKDAATEEATATERAIRLLADVTAQQAAPSTSFRSVFLMTPEVGVPEPAVVAAIAAVTGADENGGVGVDEQGSIRPISFAPVAQVADRTGSLIVDDDPVTISWSVQPIDVIGNRLTHVDAAENAVRKSVSMLPAEDPRRDSWVWQVRSAESTHLTDAEAGVLLTASLAQAEQLRQAVSPPEPFEFTLTGEDTTLRFQITNNAATPLDVLFLLKSDRLIAPEQTSLRLTPNSVTDVPIQVSARSNGSASVQVQVVTPDGMPLFAPVEMKGRVTTFGGTGKLVTVAALLILATWWLSFLSRRRRSGATPAEADAPAGPDGGNHTGLDEDGLDNDGRADHSPAAMSRTNSGNGS